MHANHPLHAPASTWLDNAFTEHEVVVAHHSIVESYAVLTRLPAKYRLTPSEAEMVLRETLRNNASLAPFVAESVWQTLGSFVDAPAAGGETYDAFIINLLASSGVEAIVTYNAREFRRLAQGVRIVQPSEL